MPRTETPSSDPLSGMARPRPGWRVLVLVFVAYLVGAKIGVWLTVMPSGIAIFWPPNAVVLAALIRFDGARFGAIAALAVGAELLADWGSFPPGVALLFGVINVAEATVGWLVLRWWRFDPDFASPADLGKFVVAAPLVGAFTAALGGATVYAVTRAGEASYAEWVRIWWLGDAIGLLILTPLWLGFPPLAAARPRLPLAAAPPRLPLALGKVDAGIAVFATGAAVLTWMAPNFGALLLLPVVLFAAARYPQRWAAAAVAAASVVLVAATTRGAHPFGPLAPADAAMRTQEFLAVMSLVALGLATLLAQLRAGAGQIEAANRQLRVLNDELESRVAARTAELSDANRRLARLANHDALTGVYNRRGWFEIAEREVARARRHGRELAVLMVDVDHFKRVNDRHGHQVGDLALQHCASVLGRTLRPGDSCGRYGGEEFVIVAPDTDLAGAATLAQRIVEAMRSHPLMAADAVLGITVSVGATALAAAADDALGDALRRADAALYDAKLSGRDRAVVHGPDGGTVTPADALLR